MNRSPPVKYYLAKIPESYRDRKIDNDRRLAAIANKIPDWQGLASHLPNVANDIEAIKHDNLSYDNQKTALLRKWLERNGHVATYSELVKGMYSAGQINTIDELVNVLRHNPLSDPAAGPHQIGFEKTQLCGLATPTTEPHPPTCTPKEVTLDLYNVKTAVFTIAVNWKQLGLALGLASHTVERIEKDHIKSGVGDCLDAALTEWLKGAYDTKRFGPPSWAQLVAAVRSEAWVNNPALASEIATKYNVTP